MSYSKFFFFFVFFNMVSFIFLQRRVASTLNYDKRNYRRYDEESYGAFHVDWNNYKFGFGDLSRGYWLGNEWISRLTSTVSLT